MNRLRGFGFHRFGHSSLLVAAVVAVIGLAMPAWAQHEGHGAPAAQAQDAGECVQGGQQGLQIVQTLEARLEGARQTNRASDLRAALGDAQAALTQLRSQLAACASAPQPPGETSGTGAAAAMDHAAMGHGGPAAEPAPVKDPVEPGCRAPIDPSTAPQAEHQGQVYYFCSEGNRQKFLASPEKYIHHHHE